MRGASLKRVAGMVLCVVFAACDSYAADNTVTVSKPGFEITFPKTWIINNDAENPVMFTAKSADAAVETGVDNQDLKNFEKLKVYVDFKFGKKVKNTISIVETKIGEREAYKVTESIAGPIIIEYYCFIAGSRVYGIWFQMSKNDSERFATEIEAILKSFKLIEPK